MNIIIITYKDIIYFYANLKLNFIFTRISKVQLSIYINFKKKKRIKTN